MHSMTNYQDDRLLKECLNSVREHQTLPSPANTQLLQQVAGANATENDYMYGGFGSSVGIRAALHSIGTTLYECTRILDFGCGPARIIRWFKDASPHAKLYGCDINPPAIDWCKANIDFAAFSVNAPIPPLPYDDAMFDLVYGISVLTHLDESMQMDWLRECSRVTKPGGIVLLTVHGEDKAKSDVGTLEYDEFRRAGFLYRAATEKATVDGLPSFYQVSFHSQQYIRTKWTELFDVLAIYPHGCMYAQDLVVLRRPAGQRTPHSMRAERHLPLAAVETPLIRSQIDNRFLAPHFDVRGWAFSPNGETPGIEVLLDGEKVGSCTPADARPPVHDAFPTVPAAANSGFSLRMSPESLGRGPHILWLRIEGEPMPLWATFFQCSTPRWKKRFAQLLWQIRCKVRLRTRLRALFNSPTAFQRDR